MLVALEEHCRSIVALALALAPPLTYHYPGELACAYAHLVHAVPPFHAAPRWEAQLAACWRRAYAVAEWLFRSSAPSPRGWRWATAFFFLAKAQNCSYSPVSFFFGLL